MYHDYGSAQKQDAGKDRALGCALLADQLVLDGSRSRYESLQRNRSQTFPPPPSPPPSQPTTNEGAGSPRHEHTHTHTIWPLFGPNLLRPLLSDEEQNHSIVIMRDGCTTRMAECWS